MLPDPILSLTWIDFFDGNYRRGSGIAHDKEWAAAARYETTAFCSGAL